MYFRFPLSLHTVEEILAARGIKVTYETVRPLRAVAARWALKSGQKTARRSRVRRSTLATKGIWMKCSSLSMARSIGCGERWISLASCWTS